jgi:hypothetical protein
MSRNKTFVLLAFIVAIAAIWQVLFAPVGETPSMEEGAALAKANDSQSIQQTEVVVRPTGEVDASERIAAEANASEPVGLDHYSGEDGLALTLVKDATGQPLPGAQLFVQPLAAAQSNARLSFGETSLGQLREQGSLYVANEDGQIHLALPTEPTRFLAEAGDLFVLDHVIELEKNELTLRLKLNQKLRVRVVHADGRPWPGYPVGLYLGFAERKFQTESILTDQDGFALVEGLDLEDVQGRFDAALFVGPGMVGTVSPEIGKEIVNVTQEKLALGSLQLLGQPMGTVELTVVRPDGTLEEREGWGSLSLEDEELAQKMLVEDRRPLEQGKVIFPYVGLGQRMSITLQQDHLLTDQRIHFDGPTEEGQVLKVELARKAGHVVTGVFLGDKRVPLASLEVRVIEERQRKGRFQDREIPVMTDHEGRFEYSVGDGKPPAGFGNEGDETGPNPLMALRFKCQIAEDEVAEGHSFVSLPPEPGVTDLGEIHLNQAGPSLQLRVVDQAGDPISNAMVSFKRIDVDSSGKASKVRIHDWNLKTKEDGTASFFGRIGDPSTFLVSLSHFKYLNVEHEVVLSPQVQDLTMLLTPTIKAVVLVDEGVLFKDISYDFELEKRLRTRFANDPETEGNSNRWIWDILAVAGQPMHLYFETSMGEIIYRSESFQIAPGEQYAPPELNPLDLRGKLKIINVRCVNEVGEDMAAAMSVEFESMSISRSDWSDGVARLVSTGVIPRIELKAPGYVTAVVENVSEDQVIELRPALKATLQIPPEYLNFRNGVVKYGGGSFVDKSGVEMSIQDVDSGKDGRAEIHFPAFGEYEIYLQYEPQFGPKKLRNRWKSHSTQTISLKADGQFVTLTVDQAELDEIVNDLERSAKHDER